MKRIALVGNLHLLINTDASYGQLRQLHNEYLLLSRTTRHYIVEIDMRLVTSFDAPALLAMVAFGERICALANVLVRSRQPQNEGASEILRDSRFHEFIAGKKGTSTFSGCVALARESSSAVLNPALWGEMQSFLQTYVSDDALEAVYTALGECTENVGQHAFTGPAREHGHWYAVALKPTSGRPGCVAILDLGIGIPRSLRRARARDRDFREKVLRMKDALFSDASCIELAARGTRTSTGESHRGKGIDGLRQQVEQADDLTLHVISHEGRVTCDGASLTKSGIRRFPGTIVCLELKPNVK
jgi:hypothetical protein